MYSSSPFKALKERLTKPTPDGLSESQKVVTFFLFKSLPDDAPLVVHQVLSKGSNLAEVLWNFSRCKDETRITLGQNPHFYAQLPRRKEAYGSDFQVDPIERFDTQEVFVLMDRPGRIYLESGLNSRSRTFGNVWVPHAIIFKDVCGKLEGDNIVRASIQGNPSLMYRLEPSSLPSSSTDSTSWEPLQDWRDPIERMLDSRDTNMHISVEQSILQSPSLQRLSRLHQGDSISSSTPAFEDDSPRAREDAGRRDIATPTCL